MIHHRHNRHRRVETFRRQTLAELPVGATARVNSLIGGKELSTRFATLGITPGVQITILQNYGYGPLTVSVRDTRLALGRGEAGWILVDNL